MRGAQASRRGLGPARSRHLGAARRAQALRLLQGDDLGRLRSRHQERRDVRLQGAAACIGAALRDAIHRDVCNRGFDAEQNAFVEVLWLETARCQRAAAAGSRLPAGIGSAHPRHDRGCRKTHDARRFCAAARSARSVGGAAADRRSIPGLQLLAGRCLCAVGRPRQGAGAVRSRRRARQRSRTTGGRV